MFEPFAQRGAIDSFTLALPNIGKLKRVLIGHDNTAIGSDWHLGELPTNRRVE
jgi:lipoxygenase homology domain-containing protein 1